MQIIRIVVIALAIGGVLLWASGSHSQPKAKSASEKAAEAIWLTDYDKAMAAAKESGKPVLVDFTGSDWCGWCIRLKDEVFTKQSFVDGAPKDYVLLELDFPRRKPQAAAVRQKNETLAKKYGIRGFPTILLLDASGKVLAKTGYRQGGPDAYLTHLKDLLKKT